MSSFTTSKRAAAAAGAAATGGGMAGQDGGVELETPLLSSPSANNDNNNEWSLPEVTNSARSYLASPRLLDRDGRFSQSRGRWGVTNTTSTRFRGAIAKNSAKNARSTAGTIAGTIGDESDWPHGISQRTSYSPTQKAPRQCCCCCLSPPFSSSSKILTRRCWDDWFHNLAYTPTLLLMLAMFTTYFLTVLLFAMLYWGVSELPATATIQDDSGFCGLDIHNHMEALYFSLSTMATIGYGVSDYYFGECWTPFFLVLFQVFLSLAYSSLAIGLLFQRMSRGQKRGRTIVFSDVSVIRKVNGTWHWMFRVAEQRNRHVIGAKVRVFLVRHERTPIHHHSNNQSNNHHVPLETAHYVSHPLSLINGSNTSLEQNILMGLPHVVVHPMDANSPLLPPRPTWYDTNGNPHGPDISNIPAEHPHKTSTNDACNPNNNTNTATSLLEESSTLHTTPSHAPSHAHQTPSSHEITQFLIDRHAEIIVFLEGTCEVTGVALQARHSYRVQDLTFHKTFAPCVFPVNNTTTATTTTTTTNNNIIPNSNQEMANMESIPNTNNQNNNQTNMTENITTENQLPHSYNYPTNKKWYQFWKKSYSSNNNNGIEIDFYQFHNLIPAPLDCSQCPYVPSSSSIVV